MINQMGFLRVGKDSRNKIKSAVLSYTLIELVVVIMIIGILASIAVPQFVRSREKAYDKEAIRTLRSIHHSERMYHLENGTSYYPSAGFVSDVSDIDSNLSLQLPQGNWIYSIGNNIATLSRNAGGFYRHWSITYVTGAQPTCTPDPGSQCP